MSLTPKGVAVAVVMILAVRQRHHRQLPKPRQYQAPVNLIVRMVTAAAATAAAAMTSAPSGTVPMISVRKQWH
jgi:hypothetical protein